MQRNQAMANVGYRNGGYFRGGLDNRPISTLVEPQLTTINVPKDIFGPAAVDLLISA